MSQLFTNNAISLLESNLLETDLIFNIIPGDGDLFPQPINPQDFFLITIEDETGQYREIIKIIDRIGDQLIIDPNGRGFEGTLIRNWPINSIVDHRITAYTLNKIDHIHSNLTNQINGYTQDALTNNIVLINQNKLADVFSTQYPFNLACKWIITILDESSFRISVLEILAAYKGLNVDPIFTVYAKTGDKLKFDVNVISVGQDLHLMINNLDTVDLRINILRINY